MVFPFSNGGLWNIGKRVSVSVLKNIQIQRWPVSVAATVGSAPFSAFPFTLSSISPIKGFGYRFTSSFFGKNAYPSSLPLSFPKTILFQKPYNKYQQPQTHYYQNLYSESQNFNITKRYKHLQNGYGSKAGNRHKGRKTRSCAKKRFNTLPDGTVVRKMTGHRHKTGWKSSRQMMRLRVTRNLSGNWAKKVKFLLGDYK